MEGGVRVEEGKEGGRERERQSANLASEIEEVGIRVEEGHNNPGCLVDVHRLDLLLQVFQVPDFHLREGGRQEGREGGMSNTIQANQAGKDAIK